MEFGSGTAETASSHVVRALARDAFEEAASVHFGTSVPPAPALRTVHTKVICHSLRISNWPSRDLFSFLAGLMYGSAIEVETVTTERRVAGALARNGAWEEVK